MPSPEILHKSAVTENVKPVSVLISEHTNIIHVPRKAEKSTQTEKPKQVFYRRRYDDDDPGAEIVQSKATNKVKPKSVLISEHTNVIHVPAKATKSRNVKRSEKEKKAEPKSLENPKGRIDSDNYKEGW